VLQNTPDEPADLAGLLCSPHATKASLLCHFVAPAAGVVWGGGRAPASICQLSCTHPHSHHRNGLEAGCAMGLAHTAVMLFRP